MALTDQAPPAPPVNGHTSARIPLQREPEDEVPPQYLAAAPEPPRPEPADSTAAPEPEQPDTPATATGQPAVSRPRFHRVRQAVTHPATKATARHTAYLGLGVVALRRTHRDARSTARHQRMMRSAEAAGQHEQALLWEERARKHLQERHDRRIEMIRAVPHLAKALVIGSGITLAGLITLGVILGASEHDVHEFTVPLMTAVHTIRWCVEVLTLFWQTAAPAIPILALVLLWNAGRHHAEHSTGWVTKLAPQKQDTGIVVTADGIVQALTQLPIRELKAAIKSGWTPAFVTPPVRDGRGYQAVFELPLDVTPAMLCDQRERFARALHRAPIEVWASDANQKGTGAVGCVDLWVADPGVLNKPAPDYPLLHEGTTDVFTGVPGGVTPRGDGLLVPIFANNHAVGGMMGQGKSNGCRVLFLGCALDPLAELWVHVFAGNGDFDAYAPRLARYHRGATDDVTAAGLQSLHDLYAEVDRREARLAELGAKKVTRALAKAHPDLRPIIVLFSECHELFGHKEYGEEAADIGAQVIRRARKSAITLMFDTQSSRKEAIPPKIVELVSVNACFAVKSWRSNDGFLGDGSFQAGIRATELRPTTDRGTSLITGVSDSTYEILKWYFIAVNDDTGWDAATDVIARSVAAISPGTRISAGAARPEPVERRDLLVDLAAVLAGADEAVPIADVPPLLRALAPAWLAYRSLTGVSLREQLLTEHGIKVPSTGNRYPLDPQVIHDVLAARAQ